MHVKVAVVVHSTGRGGAEHVAGMWIARLCKRGHEVTLFGTDAPEPTVLQVVQEPDDFDWGDAGIGGAAALALVLTAAGGAALHLDSRRQEAHG